MDRREPERAEAWFYLGAALRRARAVRVLRVERLAAARDGKRIKESLERRSRSIRRMHDAEFGIGMYRYYAGSRRRYLQLLRLLLLLPGGDREGGLRADRARQPPGTAGARRSRLSAPPALPLVRAASSTRRSRSSATCSRAIRTTRCSARSKRRSSTSTSTITPRAWPPPSAARRRAQRARCIRADIADRARAPQHREAARSTRTARSRAPRRSTRCSPANPPRRSTRSRAPAS